MKKYTSVFILFLLLMQLAVPSIVVAEKNVTTLQEEIIYQLFIDRYNNGDASLNEQVDTNDPLAYHGGDLQGIIDKLDTIDQLGFTTIALSPIMANAPMGYHGYWIEDFYKVEEQFGTIDDLNRLVKEAHKRDIKVILELVTNYVAESHSFVKDGTKKDWFKEQGVKPIPATAWLDETVMLNQDHPEVEAYLIDVAEFWMTETDIDGFKLHAADQASKQFIENLTAHIKKINPDFYVLAGTLQGSSAIDHLKNNDYIDAVENAVLFETLNDVLMQADEPMTNIFAAVDTDNENSYLKDALYVDNINSARFTQNFAENGRNTLTAWTLALTYLYTSPGVPIIYQGSEIPMYGKEFPENQMIVKFNDANKDLYQIFDQISAIRKNFSSLAYGDFEQVGIDQGMSVFKRSYGDETMYVAINNDSESRSVSVTEIDSEKQLRGLLADHIVRENTEGEYKIGLPRESVEVFIIEENKGINWVFVGFVIGVMVLFVLIVQRLSHQQKKNQS